MISQQLQPDMAQCICDHLQSWKYQVAPPQEIPNNQLLNQALRVQHRIGWQQFIEGFWSTGWRQCQEQHFKEINSAKSAILWLSKTQRKIWQIAWEMWQHRNEVLHKNNQSIHPTVREALTAEITQQWEEGLSTLPERYSNLFQGSLETKLRLDAFHQRAWLHSVWSARHRINSIYFEANPIVCDQTLRMKFMHWKAKQHTH